MLVLAIVESKVQTCWMETKGGKKKNGGDKKPGMAPVKVGTYVEFNDGNTYTIRETGKTFTGKGTRVRFNFRHGTISVQVPDILTPNSSGGYQTTTEHQPIWVEQKESGFTEKKFKESFGKRLVELAYQGHNSAMLADAAKKAA